MTLEDCIVIYLPLWPAEMKRREICSSSYQEPTQDESHRAVIGPSQPSKINLSILQTLSLASSRMLSRSRRRAAMMQVSLLRLTLKNAQHTIQDATQQ